MQEIPPNARILLSRLRFMGDVLLTTPLIRRLREAMPAAFIAYLAEATYAPLLEHNPHLNEIIAYPPAGANLLSQLRVIHTLRARRFDLAIDLFGNPRSALLTYLSGARHRVGGDYRGRGRLFTIRIPRPAAPIDAIDFHLRSLAPFGIQGGAKTTECFLQPHELQAAAHWLRAHRLEPWQPLAALHPGATWPNKRWPLSSFLEVAKCLLAEGVQVFVSCGPGEEELAVPFRALQDRRLVAGEVLPLRLLAAVLQQCRLLISNDCGVMHLAVAVKTPTIGIFGPGEPEIWFPYPPEAGHRFFVADIECRPCHQNTCPLRTLACMHATTPSAVTRTALSLLNTD